MASEIRGVASSGTLYARLMNSAGQIWNGTAFETYDAPSYSDYDIAMTEQGNSGVYVADFPTAITTAGTYEYFVHKQAGGSPAEGDTIVNTGKVDWTGTNSVTVTAATGAMSGSDWRDYVLRKGFKRTDKDSELYEATTDAIQEMRRRFDFDEATVDDETTDTIATLGDYKLDLESDMGLLLGIIVEDGESADPLVQITKGEFDRLYPYAAADTAARGYPRHFCVYAQSIYLGPTPDSTDFVYRLSYSRRAGTITSATAGVPFTNLYRDTLCDLTLSNLYDALEEPDKASYYRNKFEGGFIMAIRRERKNQGKGIFVQSQVDF